MTKESKEILTLVSKEKFRRTLLIISRIIAVFLIISIIWIGFVQMNYAKEVNVIKSEYGSLGYCYLCGLETGRTCSCNYISDLILNGGDFDMKIYLENIASNNIFPCENRNNLNKDFNFS